MFRSEDLYKIESTFFKYRISTSNHCLKMSESGNNSSSSTVEPPPLTPQELMAELIALRAEMAVIRERDAATAAATAAAEQAAAERAAAEQAAAAATSKEAVSKTSAPKASLSQALVPFTLPAGGDGRPPSPPKTTSPSNWNRYRATQRLATRMSQAAVIALHAVLESGGSLEAAAEAGRAAARRAGTPPPRNKRK
jgi:hypothetical protein